MGQIKFKAFNILDIPFSSSTKTIIKVIALYFDFAFIINFISLDINFNKFIKLTNSIIMYSIA